MNLIWVLFFCLMDYSLLSIDEDQIQKGVKKVTSFEKGFIDLDDFSGYYRLHFQVTCRNGRYDDRYLKIGGGDYKVSTWSGVSFPTYYYYDSQEYGSLTSYNHYTYHTLHFYVSKDSSWNYYYIKFPACLNSDGTFEIEITTSGISTGIVAVIVVVGIIIIAAGAIYWYYRRRKNASYIQPMPVAQPDPTYGYNPPVVYAPPAY